LVKPAAFEDHAGAAADQTEQFGLGTLGAFLELLLGHGLQNIKCVAAGGAFVLIGWHFI
jgi:hypothetical protein